jgi:hypothetical protein
MATELTEPLAFECVLWQFQQFGDETKHFCGICSALEVEPLCRKDIGAGNHAFACFVSML